MKTFRLFFLLFAGLFSASCSSDNDDDIIDPEVILPTPENPIPNPENNDEYLLVAMKGMWDDNDLDMPELEMTYDDDNLLVMAKYITTDDDEANGKTRLRWIHTTTYTRWDKLISTSTVYEYMLNDGYGEDHIEKVDFELNDKNQIVKRIAYLVSDDTVVDEVTTYEWKSDRIEKSIRKSNDGINDVVRETLYTYVGNNLSKVTTVYEHEYDGYLHVKTETMSFEVNTAKPNFFALLPAEYWLQQELSSNTYSYVPKNEVTLISIEYKDEKHEKKRDATSVLSTTENIYSSFSYVYDDKNLATNIEQTSRYVIRKTYPDNPEMDDEITSEEETYSIKPVYKKK